MWAGNVADWELVVATRKVTSVGRRELADIRKWVRSPDIVLLARWRFYLK